MLTCIKQRILLTIFLILQVDNILGEYTCGKTLYTVTAGTFQTPNFQQALNETINCTYEMSVPNKWVQLTWDSFDVDDVMPDCVNQSVAVSIGCGANEKELTKFCNRNADKPHDIYAKDGCIKIKYTERIPGSRGFKVSWKSYSMDIEKVTSVCSSDLKLDGNQGVVVTPGWPVGYDIEMHFPTFGKKVCEWDIQVSSSRKVQLNFMDLNLFTEKDNCSNSGSDRLNVNGKKSAVMGVIPSTTTYCQEKPFSLVSQYYEIELEFPSCCWNYIVPKGGFVVGYISYKSKSALMTSMMGMVVGSFVAVVVVVGIIL